MAQEPGEAPDGIVCISGLFDLLPLVSTRMLGGMGWGLDELHAVSPLFMAPPLSGGVILAVGGEESWEFHTQTTRLAQAWGSRVADVLRPAGRHHYSILEGLADPAEDLHRAALRLLGQ
jgi:arylformamidase